ncbi:MAG: hypothetical protein KatS3mg096_604 [Candidatus Parcubacteria bacterium]|nr:MAG: hypothetical protein KatS3mg096_604 [Candidatus Parcubacteria bacterium]
MEEQMEENLKIINSIKITTEIDNILKINNYFSDNDIRMLYKNYFQSSKKINFTSLLNFKYSLYLMNIIFTLWDIDKKKMEHHKILFNNRKKRDEFKYTCIVVMLRRFININNVSKILNKSMASIYNYEKEYYSELYINHNVKPNKNMEYISKTETYITLLGNYVYEFNKIKEDYFFNNTNNEN